MEQYGRPGTESGTEMGSRTDTGSEPGAGVRGPDVATMMRGLGPDIGVPLVAYYGLHLLGANDWLALLAATSAAGLVLVWAALRERRLNPFAMLMLVVFGIGLVLALVSGDPRFLLLKDSITTSIVGSAFLVASAWGRPLTLAATQRWNPARAAEITAEYRRNPHVQRGHRVSSVVWGLGLLVEAAVRVPLIFLLPISVMVGLSTAMMVGTIIGLIAWNAGYAARAARARASAERRPTRRAPTGTTGGGRLTTG